MNISIIGASAGIGLETVKIGLQRGHCITTLSRSIVQLPNNENLNQIVGDALNKTDLLAAIQNADAVIVTLGTRKSMKSTTLFSDFSKLLVEVQSKSKAQIPHIFVTGFGAGDSGNYVNWLVRLFLKYFLKEVYQDKSKMEEIISQSNLNWIIVRPGQLLDKPLTEQYRTETSLFKGINIGAINRSDVADYLVKQAENPLHLKNYVAISKK